MNIWLKNTAGKPSASLTFSTIGFFATIFWFLFSNVFGKLGDLVGSRTFDAGSALTFLTPLLALYFGRRYVDDVSLGNGKALPVTPLTQATQALVPTPQHTTQQTSTSQPTAPYRTPTHTGG